MARASFCLTRARKNGSQATAGTTYSFSYNYNLAGSLISESYPSGRVVTTAYDSANRTNAVTGQFNSAQTNYVANLTYAPFGGPALYQYGNNLWRQTNYNNRLQTSGFIDLLNTNTGSELLNASLTGGQQTATATC